MKKLLFITATAMLCFLISCTDSSTTGTTDNSRNEDNLKFNRDVLKGIETGDSSLINKHIAGDAVDHQGPNGDVKGGDRGRHMSMDKHNHVKGLRFDVLAQASSRD